MLLKKIFNKFDPEQLVVLLLLIFILRMLFPVFRYVFIGTALLILPNFLITNYKQIFNLAVLLNFIKKLYMPILLLFFYLIAFVVDGKYGMIYKEIFNAVAILVLIYLYYVFKKKYNPNCSSCNFIYKTLLIVSSIAAFLGIVLFLSRLFNLIIFDNIFTYSCGFGTSLVSDNNFYSLALLIGLVILLFVNPFKNKIINQLFFYTLVLAIVFSSSRRGVFILSILLLAYLIFAYKDRLSRIYLFSIIWGIIPLMLIFNVYIFGTSSALKTILLDNIILNNKNAKSQVANLIFDYTTIFKKKISYQEVYNKIWGTPKLYNKFYPSSGWATRPHNLVYPLNFGENNEKLNWRSIGYMLNKTCIASNWYGHAHAYSKVGQFYSNKQDTIRGGVFCFVSKEFNGERVLYEALGESVKGIKSDIYDLNEKGKWQYLKLNFVNNSEVKLYISFIKKRSKDFNDLKGFVVFAQPTVYKNNSNTIGDGVVTWKKCINPSYSFGERLRSFFDNQLLKIKINELNNFDDLLFRVFKYNHLLYSFPNNKQLLYELKQSYDQVPTGKLYKEVVTMKIQPRNSKTKNKKELISITNQLHSDDSLLHKNIEFEGKKAVLENRIVGNRKSAILFAYKIFKEYSFAEKLFGSGFKYLRMYGIKYYNNENRLDYPHNPIVSSFLYSGLIGGLFYTIFLIVSFYKYWLLRKENSIFFISYIITFFFMMFSGNSHFSVPLFAVLSFIPFIIVPYTQINNKTNE